MFEVTFADDKLMVHNIRMEPFELVHKDKAEFSAPRSPFATIAFERSGNGQITGFMGSNGRTKNVWFKRQ